MQMIIISGLSGAGKSTAGEFLEDEGFYTIDNMPATLMPRFAELCLSGNGGYDKVAMVSDIRGGKNFDELFFALDTMREMGIDCKLLFLEASVPAIIKRFKETRRSHPLEGGTLSLSQAVEGEKLLLAPVRERADYIIDSTNFANNGQLRSVLRQMFGTSSERMHLRVNVQSFGYKYGLPLEADLVWDVRFRPTPSMRRACAARPAWMSRCGNFCSGMTRPRPFWPSAGICWPSCSPCTRRRGRAPWCWPWAVPADSIARWPWPTPCPRPSGRWGIRWRRAIGI